MARMAFVNRREELSTLERWWARPGSGLALVWGRRRVGKTALLQQFARDRRTVFHVGRGAPVAEELATLARRAETVLTVPARVRRRGFDDWEEALSVLAELAATEPLLLVLDEYPELRGQDGGLDGTLRAVLQELGQRTLLRVLLCGSAVRTMQAIQEERAPLYGRLDLSLPVHPFRPHEAGELLRDLHPDDRARVWGICGGIPLYLSWWDPALDIRENVRELVARPGGLLLDEGDLVLATEGAAGGLSRQVLHAIAVGKNRHSEILEAIGGGRRGSEVLRDLEALRLVERVVPVTNDPRARSGRTTYRIADNFLAFWLGVVARYQGEIERGLGDTIIDVLLERLDDHMGPRWEEAFREHLRRMARDGALGGQVVAVGAWWTREREPAEIDAVVLAGKDSRAVLVGEAKWAGSVDGRALRRKLLRDAARLPRVDPDLRVAIAARHEVRQAGDAMVVTAADIFGA